MLWETNKAQESDDFPAYVIHFTDFSPNRKTPLERDVRVSNSREQIAQLWDALAAENVKKGWELVGGATPAVAAAVPADVPPAPAPKKPRAQKKPKAQPADVSTESPVLAEGTN